MIFLTFTLHGLSQFQPTPVRKSNNRVTLNGKNFYMHEVVKGQTLYGITQAYQVSEEEIKKLNPDLNRRMVAPGMLLRIPDPGTVLKPANGKEETKYLLHTVLPKESLSSISRQYGIRMDEIRELNPETKSGLNIGMSIKIPRDKITIEQKAPAGSEKPVKTDIDGTDQETAGDKTGQPCRIKPFPHVNDNFRLAILLPLNVSQNDTLVYSDSLKQDHFRFYEFLEGIYLATDSLRLAGLNMTIEVFDTERNPETIRGIIGDGSLNEADLIIGPVFPNEIEIVSVFAKSRHIPMVSPFSKMDVSRNNPFAFQVRNKLARQVELAASYLGSKYKQNILVVGSSEEKRDSAFNGFRENLGQQIREHDPSRKASFKTIYFNDSSKSFVNSDSKTIDLANYLPASTSNYIILPSENEVITTEVVNKLYQLSSTVNVTVFGLNQWVFNKQDPGNLFSLNLEVYTDFEDDNPFVDYNDTLVLEFCRKYKENWNIEPSKYSFHGFDIAYYFTRALFLFGRNLTASVPCWTEYLNHPAMLTTMNFQSANGANGFENRSFTVIRYEKDLLLRKKVN